jgi:hypothetical protein
MKMKLDLSTSAGIVGLLEDPKSRGDIVLVEATVSSLRNVWWVIAGFALLSLILACCTCEHGLGGRVSQDSDSVSVGKDSDSSVVSKEQV